MFGVHLIHHWSKMQANLALSSGEAELNASVKGGAESLCVSRVLESIGQTVTIRHWCDSSAARGILQRSGVGKLKHLQTKQLWLQELVKSAIMSTYRIPRDANASDCLTHPTSHIVLHKHLSQMNYELRTTAL